MPLSSTKTAPSGYSQVRLLFHGLRTFQLLSALITGGIMSYFMYHLHHDKIAIPWTFIVLLVVSLLTIVFLSATIMLHCLTGLNPRLNLALNTTLLALWVMGFTMLSWYSWHTLTHLCDFVNWKDGTGIMVCRVYKALFAFAGVGLIFTIAALALDVYIYRLSISRGRHMRLDDMDHKGRKPAVAGPYTDTHDEEQVDGFPSRHSEAFDMPSAYFAKSGDKEMQSKGYNVPEAQFDYDTGYRGGHEDRAYGA